MGKIDLSKYETVKERKKRFYKDHPDGCIIVENKSDNILEYALIKAYIYLDMELLKNNLPKSTGYALEIRDKELTYSKKHDYEYESVNYTSWVENCEESAIGRALDNAGYAGNDKCSREEMEKVERQKTAINNNKKSANKTEPPKLNDMDKKIEICESLAEYIKEDTFTKEEIDVYRQELKILKNNDNSKVSAYQDMLDRVKAEYNKRNSIDDAEAAFDEKPLDFEDDDPEKVNEKDIPIY